MKNGRMKTILLQTLTIRRFKGCAALKLNFDGRSARIYGANGTGKTTIYDAFCYLLFDKDSGGAKDFDIKPHDGSGAVLDHGALSEVEAELTVDGAPLALRKAYGEKWTKKRGGGTEMSGHITEYAIDGVPVKKGEYAARIGALVDEELFRALTSVTWFCEDADWRKRRDLLLAICGIPEDRDLLAADERFADLSRALGELSVEDGKKKFLARRKRLNGARDTIPARLDEQQKLIAALQGADFAVLRAQRAAAAAEADRIRAELLREEHGALLTAKDNELAQARLALQSLELENERHRQAQQRTAEDPRPALERNLRAAREEAARRVRALQAEQDEIGRLNARLDELRRAWLDADRETCPDADTCPTCGQVLPPAMRQAAIARFADEKARRQADIVARAKRAKDLLHAAEERKAAATAALSQAKLEAESIEDELSRVPAPNPPEIRDLPGYAAKREALQRSIDGIQSGIAALRLDRAQVIGPMRDALEQARRTVDALDREIAKEELLRQAEHRAEELTAEARQAAAEMEELDRLLELCEDFARCKARRMEETVNGHFRLARFRLFREQVNGGLADCCDVLVNGSAVGRGLNTGACRNAGIDVISVLSDYYGLRVPLFLDGWESVSSTLPIDTQVITLNVSAADKELRCEYEDR